MWSSGKAPAVSGAISRLPKRGSSEPCKGGGIPAFVVTGMRARLPGGDAGGGFSFVHGVEAMRMGGKSGAAGTGRDEEIADARADGDEPLQVSGGSKGLHRPLASSQRQERIFRPVAGALARAMLDRRHDLSSGDGVG